MATNRPPRNDCHDGASGRCFVTRSTLWRRIPPTLGTLLLLAVGLIAFRVEAASRTNALLIELEGQVLVSRAGSAAWDPGRTNQLLLPQDRIRTMESSRAVLRLSDLSTVRLGPNSQVQIPDDSPSGAFQLLRGLLYYFHRDRPGTLPVRTPTAYAVSLGTEFAVTVEADTSTRIDLIEGRVELTNDLGALSLTSGQAAIVAPGQAPRPTPAIATVNVVQWVLHYPAVLDPDDLQLTPNETIALADVLAAYRAGDLGRSIGALPAEAAGDSIRSRTLRAALRLSVGDVPAAEATLNSMANVTNSDPIHHSIRALQTLIAAVRYQPGADPPNRLAVAVDSSPLTTLLGSNDAHWSASALLAESYYAQSRRDLARARLLARQATEWSPRLGLAWARLAELEFSFGDRRAAARALDQALEFSPRHAAAHAVQGFVYAGANRMADASRAFDQAIALDGALGLAWLGRGLVRIRTGDRAGGRDDLQTAATLEPQRAMFRSYLAKAQAQLADDQLARHEVDLARILDPLDPTGWFYSALLDREQNRINPAIRNLERAAELNDGRQVIRSRVLLDQDAAVQGTHLAGLYADAGLMEWSAQQAGRAVQLDPANYAAHLFLADSHQRLRDPGRVSQRFETAAVSEYLLAHLLSPVGAGTLAQAVTANEYSSLFTTDGPGFASSTEYLSRGAWTASAAHYGTLHRSSFALSGFYRSDPGQRANNDSEQYELTAQFKQQLTAADHIYLNVTEGAFEGGDLLARQDPNRANSTLRIHEEQTPIVFAGHHHEWGPGQHTLALAGWASDVQHVRNDLQDTLILDKTPAGTNINFVLPALVDQRYRARAGIFTAELQQIWQRERQAAILGARFQNGSLEVTNTAQNLIVPLVPGPGILVPSQRIEEDFHRASGYGYYQIEPVAGLLLVAGLSYDWLSHPRNFRFAPIVEGDEEHEQLSPKGGVVWRPGQRTTLRAGYAQSLGGVGFEQSLRLEPTQVAGFNQAYRSLIPESVAGANSGATFETMGAAFEQRVGAGTFLSLSGEWLRSGVERTLGVYDFTGPVAPSTTRQRLAYEERTLVASAHQLLGDEWSLGLRYRISGAELRGHYLEFPSPMPVPVPGGGGVEARSNTDAWLHQLGLVALYYHRSGFFAGADGVWNRQVSNGDGGTPDESFWQCNLHGGWRGWRRRIEIRVGLLNVFDQDYRLNPLNLTAELPRERTLMVSGRLQF